MTKKFRTSGQVAQQVGIPRWKLLYLIERGVLPAPSAEVPGRRLFTDADLAAIRRRLKRQPLTEPQTANVKTPERSANGGPAQ